MSSCQLFFTFAEITFPMALLVPGLLTSMRVLVPVEDMATVYSLLASYYLVISGVAVYSLAARAERSLFCVTVACVFLVGWILFYVIRWTLHQQVVLLVEAGLHARER